MHAQPQFPSYGYCDSYFVDNHDDDEGVYARAIAERDRQRAFAKLRQKALADELSRATADEYQEDILDHMERMEVSDLVYLLMMLLLIHSRSKPCLTSSLSRYKQRFNGL